MTKFRLDKWPNHKNTYSLLHDWSLFSPPVYIGLHGDMVVTFWDWVPEYKRHYYVLRIADAMGWDRSEALNANSGCFLMSPLRPDA